MSADNWADCPKCKMKYEKVLLNLEQKKNKLYGKIPLEDWEALQKEPLPKFNSETLREDFAIGIFTEGGFYIDYSGACTVCGFKFIYKFSKDLQKEINSES